MSTSMIQVAVLLLAAQVAFSAKDLPKNSPRCHRFDPKLNDCILKASEQVRPILVKGIPGLGIPPIDKIVIPQIVFDQSAGAISIKAVLRDVKLMGLSNYKFSLMNFNVKDLKFDGKGQISPLKVEGDYTVNGNVLGAPITGEGKFTADVENVNMVVHRNLEIIKKSDGLEYLHSNDTQVSIQVEKPKVHLEGLFGNDPQLSETTNRIINENADVLFQDLRPAVENVINQLVDKLIFQTLDDQIPFDKLYPPIP